MFSISKAKYASYMGPTLKLQDEGGGGRKQATGILAI